MHFWQIAPDARQHLAEAINDAFKLGDTVKIDQSTDGAFRVTSPAYLPYGDSNRHDGVILSVLDRYIPTTGDVDRLANLLDVALSWQSYIVITTHTDEDEGLSWLIHSPDSYATTAEGKADAALEADTDDTDAIDALETADVDVD